MAAATRLMRGEPLETLSRELGVTVGTLSAWCQSALDAGLAALKSRPGDERDDAIYGLKAMVGDLTMRLEVSRDAVRRLKGGRPLAGGRLSK